MTHPVDYDDERDELERSDEPPELYDPEERIYAAMLGYRCEDE